MALREGGFVESLGPIRATPFHGAPTEPHTRTSANSRQEARMGRSHGLRWAGVILAIDTCRRC